MPHRRTSAPVTTAVAMTAAALVVALAGCSSDSGTEGSSGGNVATATGTSCNLSGCTVVLQRGVDARTTVLGVPVELVGATGNQVSLSVAGHAVTVPLDAQTSTEVAGLAVSLQSMDADRIVLRVTKA